MFKDFLNITDKESELDNSWAVPLGLKAFELWSWGSGPQSWHFLSSEDMAVNVNEGSEEKIMLIDEMWI